MIARKKRRLGRIGALGGVALLVVIGLSFGGGMTELRHEIFIQAPAEKVWGVLTNLEAVSRYNPGVAEAHYISPQRDGVGAARECRLKDKSSIKERVSAVNPGKSVTMELYESNWPVVGMTWTTELHPESSGTRVSQRLSYEPKGLFGRILNFFVMKRMMNKNLTEIFVNLKGFVEDKG